MTHKVINDKHMAGLNRTKKNQTNLKTLGGDGGSYTPLDDTDEHRVKIVLVGGGHGSATHQMLLAAQRKRALDMEIMTMDTRDTPSNTLLRDDLCGFADHIIKMKNSSLSLGQLARRNDLADTVADIPPVRPSWFELKVCRSETLYIDQTPFSEYEHYLGFAERRMEMFKEVYQSNFIDLDETHAQIIGSVNYRPALDNVTLKRILPR